MSRFPRTRGQQNEARRERLGREAAQIKPIPAGQIPALDQARADIAEKERLRRERAKG